MRTLDGFNPDGLATLPFVVCDADGVIVRTGSAPVILIDPQATAGEVVLVGEANQFSQYVDLSNNTTRQKAEIIPTVTGLDVFNLPSPCMLCTEGFSGEVVGGMASLSYDVPGAYSVVITARHHLASIFEVTQP